MTTVAASGCSVRRRGTVVEMRARWMRSRAVTGGFLALVVMLLVIIIDAPPATAGVYVGEEPAPSWRVNGRVWATKIVGDTVYVGGTFTSAAGPGGQSVARRNLAAFDIHTGALRMAWRADAGAPVRALASDGTWLVVGGAFGQIGGVPRGRIARVSLVDGAVDSTFAPEFNDNIRAMDVDGGAVYVGGLFTTVNGTSRPRIAKIRAQDGSLDTQFSATANNAVWGLAKNPKSPEIYVSGPFSTLNGAPRQGVGAVSSTTGATSPTVFASSERPTLALTTNGDGTRLFGGGGTGGNALAAWNTTTGVRAWRQVAMGDVQTVKYYRGMVYFGFHDGYQDDTRLKVLAADESTGLVDPEFRPRFDGFWGVFAVDASDAGVVVGGEFTTISGVAAQGWARFPTQGELPPIPVTTRYLDSLSAWKYWDAGTRPTSWQEPAFVDDSWAQGRPQFGYGDGDEVTPVSYGPNPSQRYITTYFRTTFNVTSLPDVVTANVLADDGAVIYVNGLEVARDNMSSGAVSNSTRALSNRAGADENALRAFNIPVQYLHVGDNSIAVEVHQYSSGSSDLSFDLDLVGQSTGEPDPPGPGEPVITEVIGEPASWEWRYLQDPPPVDWKSPSFVATGWSAGGAPLGWGSPGPITTNIDTYANTQDRPRAAYFRREFEVPIGSTPVGLRLTTVADDGVVVYFNGVEVGRSNMPPGQVTHTTYASSARGTAVANSDLINIDVPPSLITIGTNVVTVETHLNYRATPNLSFKLKATLTSNQG